MRIQQKVKHVMGHVILEASQHPGKVSDFIFFCVQKGTAQVTRERTTIRLQASCFDNYLWPYKTWLFPWWFGAIKHDFFPDGLVSFTTEKPAQMRQTTKTPPNHDAVRGCNPAPNRLWERWPSMCSPLTFKNTQVTVHRTCQQKQT